MTDGYGNISAIETFYDAILTGNISKNVFPATPPQTVPDSWKEMIVISCDTGISDYNAYAAGYVELWFYVKPMPSGKKNVAVMDSMEKKLDAIISETVQTNDHYRLTKSETRTDYDSVRNMHINIIRIYTLII